MTGEAIAVGARGLLSWTVLVLVTVWCVALQRFLWVFVKRGRMIYFWGMRVECGGELM